MGANVVVDSRSQKRADEAAQTGFVTSEVLYADGGWQAYGWARATSSEGGNDVGLTPFLSLRPVLSHESSTHRPPYSSRTVTSRDADTVTLRRRERSSLYQNIE
ncbi:hypothetical protein [Halogranum rubrum]|uniref:Uncharacterized protein n=1 Tax=Halogranum salarium B-1 TaxID=1210908 RepID=J3JDS1_9EURY|nr:hypothetical protein [Halogranum salarium]EJN57734.1 hypothetical protein HSB1_40950 [Halogranum salarium B-1]